MIRRLRLKNFKNFKDVELILGPFTLLIGANASGKSNIGDAFRFLNGIGRKYKIADILGEVFVGGGLQWSGIRGGAREIVFKGEETFEIEIEFDLHDKPGSVTATYQIEVDPGGGKKKPKIISESLKIIDVVFSAKSQRAGGNYFHLINEQLFGFHPGSLLPPGEPRPSRGDIKWPLPDVSQFPNNTPLITQLENYYSSAAWGMSDKERPAFITYLQKTMSMLGSIRFLSLNPDVLRIPSSPGQTVLGDRGENFSSVLQAILDDRSWKIGLTEWLKQLTPMDAKRFEFPSDLSGKILLTLVEENGLKISANSASDGTLRFLAIAAGLLGPERANLNFIDELENGIHPARLHVLLDLIQQETGKGKVQIIGTTHSPQLLRLVSKDTVKNSSLIYRLEGKSDAQIKRIYDLPEDGRKVIERDDIGQLFESGWFEDILSFLSNGED